MKEKPTFDNVFFLLAVFLYFKKKQSLQTYELLRPTLGTFHPPSGVSNVNCNNGPSVPSVTNAYESAGTVLRTFNDVRETPELGVVLKG